MRGKLFDFPACTAGIGITPADAGKTHRKANRVGKKEDHPRGCGENNKY